MASQDARLSKFEADFKQLQSEMTNKIDTFLKAINDRMTGALPSDTVKNPKLNVNPTSFVSPARSYPMEETDHVFGLCVNLIPLYLFKKLKIRLLEETDHVFGLADGTKSYPVGIVKNVESEELIEKRMDWNKPPKEGDGVWHINIELVDPDGDKFNRTFQSIPTTRKLSENENPSKIIDLDHFHDS
ncbi:hypothetical protein Tco_0768799 [Tanacetum coccineum]